jgi:hypothetical protein
VNLKAWKRIAMTNHPEPPKPHALRRGRKRGGADQSLLGRFFGPSGHMVYYVALICILLSATCTMTFALAGTGEEFQRYASQLLTLGVGLLGGRALR